MNQSIIGTIKPNMFYVRIIDLDENYDISLMLLRLNSLERKFKIQLGT